MSEENATYPKAVTGTPIALETRAGQGDGRLFSPSIGRNKDAVRDAFLTAMPRVGDILEIASGTGEHGAHITNVAPSLTWTYTDIDPGSLQSQGAWVSHVDHTRLKGPLELNVMTDHWGEAERSFDGIFCANMIHIAPFAAAKGLLSGAGRILRSEGRLMVYGPFARNGNIAESNVRFSEDLKRRDQRWGVRDLDLDVVPLAKLAGLKLTNVIEMPANNLSVMFEKT